MTAAPPISRPASQTARRLPRAAREKQTPARTRVRLGRVGWYYVAIAALLFGGAVFRQMEVLIVASSLMAAPLLLNWRLARSAVRNLAASRRLPRAAVAGEPFNVLLVVSAAPRSSGRMLVAQDRVRAVEASAAGATTVSIPYVDAHLPARCAYRCCLTRRGRYRFESLRLASGFPFGLLTAEADFAATNEIIVLPRLGRLTRAWRLRQGGDRDGVRHSRNRSLLEGEFFGIRRWRPGDCRRWIHWRTSAKLQQLAVRQFELPPARDMAVILDLPPSPQEYDERVETAISFAATLIVDACREGRGGRLLLAGLSDEASGGPQLASPAVARQALESLALARGGSGIGWEEALRLAARRMPPPAIVYVVGARPRPVGAGAAVWIDVTDGEFSDWFHLPPLEPIA